MVKFSSLVVSECVSSQHATRVALGVAHARRNIALASSCSDLILRAKGKFYISIIHVFGHAGKPGNECADIAASFGMNGFISECNVSSSFGLPSNFWCNTPFDVPHCLSRVAEVFEVALCPIQTFFLSSLGLVLRTVHFFELLCALCFYAVVLFKVSLPTPPLFSSAMADAYMWVSAYIPHPVRLNEVVQMFWKEERQGSAGAWRARRRPTSGLRPRFYLQRREARRRDLVGRHGLFSCSSA